MKLNKRLFYFSIIVSIFILIITIYLNFHLKYSDIAQYISNILLNILSGLIVLIVTSLFDYFIKRRECLEEIMLQCQYLALEFDKIKYFEEKTVDGMLEANKKDSKISSEDEEDIKEYVETENVKNLENIMDEYIKLSESNLNEFWNLYRDLDFLFDIKEKKKKELWNEIFNYVSIKINRIREDTYHFKIYKESKHGNYYVNASKLLKLQEEIFYVETQEWKSSSEESWDRNLLQVKSSYSVNFNIVDKTKTLIINDVTSHLFDMYDKIAKIAYYDKKQYE